MPELQDILEQYGKQYKEKHSLPIYVKKTLNAIEKCRTAELGAHEDICDHCGYKKISYNSCRNRHCPKCQTSAKENADTGEKEATGDFSEVKDAGEYVLEYFASFTIIVLWLLLIIIRKN